jgi:hypothetical protein
MRTAVRNDEGLLQVLHRLSSSVDRALCGLAGLVRPAWGRSRASRDRLPHHGTARGKVRNQPLQPAVLLLEGLETLSLIDVPTVPVSCREAAALLRQR